MILADTSIWIDHLRTPDSRLQLALDRRDVAMHPFIVGELACGTLRNREELIRTWRELPSMPLASDAEALALLEKRRLMGAGLGYIDVHLLASVTLAATARLWTKDKSLAEAASKLNLIHHP
ncbi:MAG: type II toxin-antitoxin system VapC family toxin [Gemmatimonadota bacterium]